MSDDTIYRALKDIGLLACERQTEGLQAGCRSHGRVQKNFAERVADIRAQLAPGTPVEVWFQDEMRVGQKNKLTYRWARKGSRPRASHDQRTQSTYLFGAVCPQRGAGAALVLPRAQHRGHAASSRRDRHQGQNQRPHQIHPRSSRMAWRERPKGPKQYLPPAAATARARAQQPRKHLAVHAAGDWISNRIFKSFDDIVDHCCYAWNTLIDQPWKIMSIAHRDWAIVGHSL